MKIKPKSIFEFKSCWFRLEFNLVFFTPKIKLNERKEREEEGAVNCNANAQKLDLKTFSLLVKKLQNIIAEAIDRVGQEEKGKKNFF